MTILCMLIMTGLFPAQAAQEDKGKGEEPSLLVLMQQISDLKHENEQLRQKLEEIESGKSSLGEKIDALDRKMVEMAKENLRLRQLLREATAPTQPPVETKPVVQPPAQLPSPFPIAPAKRSIMGEVISNNPQVEVLLVRPGMNGGVVKGQKFEVMRKGKRVAAIEIVKVDPQISSAKVVEGKRSEIQSYDSIIELIASENPANPPVGNDKRDDDPLGDSVIASSLKISGQVGDEYVITGVTEKLKLGSTVYVYRNKILQGIITITKVDGEGALGIMASGSTGGKIESGDEVVLKEKKSPIQGIVKLVSAQTIALTIGTSQGVTVGQKYEVTRLGNFIATIEITDVREVFSFAKESGGASRAAIMAGDTVRLKED